MKKLIIIPLFLILLCGCNKVKEVTSGVELNSDLIYDNSEKEYIDMYFANTKAESEFTEMAAYETSKLVPLDITLTMTGRPKDKAKIYEKKDMDFLIITDGRIYDVCNENVGIPRAYSELINGFISNKWHFTGSITGAELNRLDFGNNEYVIAENPGYFSLSNEVSLNSDNIPIGISLFTEGSNVTKLYIRYYDLPYMTKKLSDDNINFLRYALTKFGISDTDAVADIFQSFIKNETLSVQNISGCNIEFIDPADIQRNIGTMIITLN